MCVVCVSVCGVCVCWGGGAGGGEGGRRGLLTTIHSTCTLPNQTCWAPQWVLDQMSGTARYITTHVASVLTPGVLAVLVLHYLSLLSFFPFLV